MTIIESILTLLKQASFFEAARVALKISSSLWISNFNQVKLVQIREKHCRRWKSMNEGGWGRCFGKNYASRNPRHEVLEIEQHDVSTNLDFSYLTTFLNDDITK